MIIGMLAIERDKMIDSIASSDEEEEEEEKETNVL
jgi:hypothetical protein